jgi:Na+/melibiose symporter-like transporter
MAQLISFLNLLVSTSQLTIILIIVAGIFLIFIVIAVIKTYKLNAENKILTELDNQKSEEDTSYKDFTDGHLYDNK